MATADIASLIARTALKDRAAFSALYQLTSAKLFGVCLRILRERSEAEDAVQEIYVKVWQRADRFAAGPYSPMSWLIAVARNHCLDRLRGRRAPAADLDAAYDIPDEGPTPEQTTLGSETARSIEGCLETLETARADAVRGAYLDGQSYAELAETHNVPLNTMRTWLRRSLIKLKECLSQ